MSATLIPAGDSGEYIITDEMMMYTNATSMSIFSNMLGVEAEARGLNVAVEEVLEPSGYRVRWWERVG